MKKENQKQKINAEGMEDYAEDAEREKMKKGKVAHDDKSEKCLIQRNSRPKYV